MVVKEHEGTDETIVIEETLSDTAVWEICQVTLKEGMQNGSSWVVKPVTVVALPRTCYFWRLSYQTEV